jgi:hypothetical protein
MNIRRHGRHVGRPAYVRRLMRRPDEHKRVYPAPPFLSPASLSLSRISSTRCDVRHRRHQLLLTLPSQPAPCWRRPTPALPWPCLTPDLPRTASPTPDLLRLVSTSPAAPDPLRPSRRLLDRARPRPAPVVPDSPRPS